MTNSTQWLPIETALRESWIIGFWECGYIEKVMITSDGEDCEYHVLEDGEQHRKMPTHWIPIPTMPK